MATNEPMSQSDLRVWLIGPLVNWSIGVPMDRAIPFSASEEIELYQRTYYSLLRSSGEIQIKALIETHAQMDSSLHIHARAEFPDMAAFVYSTLRLPDCIRSVRLVLLGQSDEVFLKAGFTDVEQWKE